jgi:hypothetical protein
VLQGLRHSHPVARTCDRHRGSGDLVVVSRVIAISAAMTLGLGDLVLRQIRRPVRALTKPMYGTKLFAASGCP